jgi:hypothetical protein
MNTSFSKVLLVLVVLFCSVSLTAQRNLFLTITPKVGGIDLQVGANYTDLQGVTFAIDHFDYYLSNLHILHDGGQDLSYSDTVFLIEPSNFVLDLGTPTISQIESITFSIGVPPNLNTSAGADAMDITFYPENHPLSFQDPSMFWGWSAGYMHMIIGGYADGNNDGVPTDYFELHNLGDVNFKTKTLPIIQTNTNSNQLDVHLNCNVDKWLKNIAIQSAGITHGSKQLNVAVMDNVLSETVFDQSGTATVPIVTQPIGNVFAVHTESNVAVTWENVIGHAAFRLTDNSGKTIQYAANDAVNGNIVFSDLPSGLYFFELLNANQNKLNTLKFTK